MTQRLTRQGVPDLNGGQVNARKHHVCWQFIRSYRMLDMQTGACVLYKSVCTDCRRPERL